MTDPEFKKKLLDTLSQDTKLKKYVDHSKEISSSFGQATTWTPTKIVGGVICAIGLSLLFHLAHAAPKGDMFDSYEGIISFVLITIGGLVASYQYTLFQWNRTCKQYQLLGRGPILLVTAIVFLVIVVLAYVVIHAMTQELAS